MSREGKNNPNWKGGISADKRARREYQKAWYERNKDTAEFKEKQRENNKKYAARKREIGAQWKENNPRLAILSNARYRAKRKGLEFNLELEDILIPDKCPYLGVKLTSHKLKGHLNSHMSLDRVDSSKGYIKGNVEVISYKANMMKQDATKEQLLIFAKNIIRRFNDG